MEIRAIAYDWDGTLSSWGRDPALARVLDPLRARGVVSVIDTARVLPFMIGEDGIDTLDELRLFDYVIGEGGGVGVDPYSAAITSGRHGLTVDQESGGVRAFALHHDPEVLEALATAGVRPFQVGRCCIELHAHDRARADAALDGLNLRRQQIGRPETVLSVVGTNGYLTYLSPGVDKATTLGIYLGERGISLREAAAAGDGLNDIPMLRAVALAIIPANAHPDVKALPNAVVATLPGRAGVQQILNQLLRHQLPGFNLPRPQNTLHGNLA